MDLIEGEPVSLSKKFSFLSGLLVIYIAQGSPLSVLGHHFLFSAHMLQMALMYMVVPPLLILGTPTWMFQKLFERPKVKKIFSFLTSPVPTLVLFNGLFSFYHVPIVFDTVMAYPVLQTFYHTVLTVMAFFMWWPMLCPITEMDRLSEVQKMGYIIGGSVLITPVCALVIFSNTLLYSTYVGAPQIFQFISSYDDQQAGGIVMKLIQEAAYGTGLVIIFFRWIKKDSSINAIDPVETPQFIEDNNDKAHKY